MMQTQPKIGYKYGIDVRVTGMSYDSGTIFVTIDLGGEKVIVELERFWDNIYCNATLKE